MDRKKTIVAAVMINAGILTALFIAAMTTREEPVEVKEIGRALQNLEPLFKETVEVPEEVPLVAAAPLPVQPSPFSLPPVAPAEQKPLPPALVEAPLAAAPTLALEIEVQKGDTLDKLAKTHRTSVDEIIKLNHLPSSFLKVGQRLKLPAEKTYEAARPKSLPPAATENAEYYTMKVGDNPWSIAMRHHIKVDELLKLNGLNEKSARKLKPGDRLRIK